jgi:NTF2 fold immunity protein
VRTCVAICCSVLLVSIALGQVRPKEGFVPDAKTAVKIAEAVLVPVYGQTKMESERPFTAKLTDDVWTVYGTLHCPDGKAGCRGGAAEVQISKTDGRILSLTFGR